MVTHQFRAMGSRILTILDAPQARASTRLADVQGCFDRWEQSLSRFRPDSELSALNRSSGGKASVSPTLAAVLAAALRGARQTDGLVTPTILGALEQAGYDRDFAALADADAEHAPSALAAAALPVADWRSIRLNERRGTIYLPAGLRLDLGGIAKGWAADRAAHALNAVGPALIDAGGDIAVSGPRADGTPWPIGVDDPFGGNEPLDILLLATGGVATSGRDYRRWQQGSHKRHHIIDPRTGTPADTDLLSVTVVAASVGEAEVAAKAVLILGSAAGQAWIEARPWLAGLLVQADGTLIRTATLDAFRWGAMHTDSPTATTIAHTDSSGGIPNA